MRSISLINGFYQLAEKVMRLMQFQLLWILFSLCGGLILGFMPATVGLFTVIRRWMLGNEDNKSYTSVYWTTFRKEFWKANGLGLILSIMGFLLYMNFSLIRFSHGVIYWCLLILVIMASILFIVLMLYIIPVYVHIENRFSRYFSISLLMGVSFPFHTLLMVIGFYLLLLLFKTVPGLIPFLSIGPISCLSMWISMKVFTLKDERKAIRQKHI
ncbi:YesL family protein [Neobacillus niacini]|uniref:YesL family protein n=1 Tax=Neobacillus niacini TaxID=86668 RepID=UPI0007ABC478|nr:YesL family protein [Neobacillus niacini]MEC1525936.1 YesL family protein [Neobacillus niacini]